MMGCTYSRNGNGDERPGCNGAGSPHPTLRTTQIAAGITTRSVYEAVPRDAFIGGRGRLGSRAPGAAEETPHGLSS